ncbi:restriction endonuclease subunit S [Acinetobacter sp. YH16050]|uniref:restriction endonuclease subunit S n=1 Tax=Acinetobacter sp. YH16050 TaxID=2601189 RepID=UPI0015D2F70A|nr:restriction endonuclease subunit S [Acinetobacter sp. YH16050]
MVPNGWKSYQLSELCAKPISYGIVQTGENIEDGISCLRVVDLSNEKMNPNEMIKTSHEINQAYKKTILEDNEIVMALRGDVGLVRLIDANLVGANITRGLARISAKKGIIHPEYLLWELRSPRFRADLIRRVGGSALQEISLSELRKINTLVPSLNEQKKIAQILSTWDQAISVTEKLLENSQQQKKALMQQLLTGKQRLLDENGVRFSGDWGKIKLGNLIVQHSEKTEINDQYPVLTSSRKGLFFQKDYYNGRDIASDDTTGYNVVPYGYFTYRHMSDDLVFSFNINNLCEKGIVSTLYPVFKAREELVIPGLLRLILNEGLAFKKFSLEQKQGGSRTYMYLSKLKELKLMIPPMKEQKKIIEILSIAHGGIENLQKKLDCLKQEKKVLMQQLLTGKKRVKVAA